MSEVLIHPTAIIDPDAKLGQSVRVCAYAVIEHDTIIGDHAMIGHHATIHAGTRIGAYSKIHSSASIGGEPQDLKYNGEATQTHIGAHTKIHEYVTINRGTSASGETRVGSHTLIMTHAHVGHDCVIGNNCVVSNCAAIGGHVEMGDWAIIGGNGSGVHQFGKIGQHAMTSTESPLRKDIPPYVFIGGEPGRFCGINSRGLQKRNFSQDTISQIKEAYHIIYHQSLTRNKAIEEVLKRVPESKERGHIIDFIRASERGIIKK